MTFFFFDLPEIDWYDKSSTNICYVSYKYANKKTHVLNVGFHVNDMLKSRRMEFVALESRNFFDKIRNICIHIKKDECQLKTINKLKALGFSLGAHLAALFCRYIHDFYKKSIANGFNKVGLLLGIYFFFLLLFYQNQFLIWILNYFYN